MGRLWRLRSAGNKTDLVYRVFVFLKDCNERCVDVCGKMATNLHCPSLETFQGAHGRSCLDWKAPPSIEHMTNGLKGTGDMFSTPDRPLGRSERNVVLDCGEKDEETLSNPKVTLSEFLRLVVLMRDDERVRASFYRLGQELKSAELDSGASRDSFWGIIEGMFKDSSV